MAIKNILNSIKDSVSFGWTGTTDTISELIDLLRDDNDKIIDYEKLNGLLFATNSKKSASFYYQNVVSKISELFPAQKAQAPVLYDSKMHFVYMKYLLADYLANSSYTENSFSDITDFNDLQFEETKFLDGTINTAPTNFSLSWNKLIDLLAGADVDLGAAEDTIKERLNKANLSALGESSKSLGNFLATATEQQQKIFKKNFEQDLLIADFGYFASFRNILRFFELFQTSAADGSDNATGTAIKQMFQALSTTEANFKDVKGNRGLPYGGRICPVTFINNKTSINNLKTHPFSWMFFKDIKDLTNVKSKVSFYKMIYRNGKQIEVPLPIKLPEQISSDGESKEEEEESGDVIRSKCEINKDYSDLQNVRLEDINISFKGTTPTTAQNDVDVSITLHLPRIASLKEPFSAPYGDGEDETYVWKILDFITYYGNSDLRSEQDLGFIQNVKYSGINSRLILKVGYDETAMPNKILKDVLENSPMILDLSVIDHTIAKDPIKPFAKLTIKYAGHIMKMFNSPMTDVLGANKLDKRIERQKIISLAQEQNCQPRIVEQLFNINRQINKNENLDIGQNLINSLYKRKRIFKTPFSPSTILQNSSILGENVYFSYNFSSIFRQDLSTRSFIQWDNILGQESAGDIGDIGSSVVDRAKGARVGGGGTESFFAEDVYWTTIGDVIDVAMDSIYKFDSSGALSNTIGNIRKVETVKDFFKFNKIKVITTDLHGANIADYPVSITFLQEWIKEEIINQEFDFYPLMGFIKQLIQACITNPINKRSQMETPILINVDSDLGLPHNDPTTSEKLLKRNLSNIDLFWKNRIKNLKKTRSSRVPYKSSLNVLKAEIVKEGGYKAACVQNETIDKKIFNEYIATDTSNSTPIIRKKYNSKRQDYYTYIYCHAIESKLDETLPMIKNESECIAHGIPVIRLPDYKYTNVEELESTSETEAKEPPATGMDLSALAGNLNQEKQKAIQKSNKSQAKKAASSPLPKTTQKIQGQAYSNVAVKSIKFTKKDDDYLREARYSSQHYGLFAQLSSVYSATVELTMICTFLTPGMIVYLDADTGDTIFQEGSLANALGLGGMHIITSVQHKAVFEDNELKGFTTSFDALYCYKGSNIKVTPKKDTTTIMKENKTKEKLCDELFDVLKSSAGGGASTNITAEEALAVFPSISATPTETDVKAYYKQQEIKDVYKVLHQRKASVEITDMEFVDTWRPDWVDPIPKKMYKVTVDEESYHINFLGEKLNGE